MKKIFTSALLMMLGIIGMNAQTAIYSWESPEGTVVETGGKITQVNGTDNRLNYPQADYYTICLNGKKGNMNEEETSNNACRMVITLDQALQAGDKIDMTAFINKNESKKSSPYFVFENGTTLEGEIYSDAENIGMSGKVTTKTMTVPEAAAGSKTITMTRSQAGTNLFITKLVVSRESEAPSLNGKLVIGKVFYAGSTRLNGATPKNYMKHLFIELYNNSAEAIDVAGLYVAMANSDAAANAWTATAMADEHPDSAVVKQIFQIPADAPVMLEAGKSIVIANCAIDHSEIAEGNVNLSDADFEVKSANAGFADHNDAVPALTVVKTFGTTDFINFLNPGPDGIVLLPADTDTQSCPETYAKGKTAGSLYTIVPMKNSIDCVDIVKQKTPSADDKRFGESYDAGFTCTVDPGNFNCQAVARKVIGAEDGRYVLKDTNDSSDDFETLANLQPRVYGVDIVTGIQTVTTTAQPAGIFNLQGQRMNTVQKGLYIVNGKKVIVK